MKKFIVLGVLFALPIVAYLFFASGKNNFAKLPILTEKVQDVAAFESLDGSTVSFDSKISVVAFYGDNLDDIRGNTFNLDQKILDKYYGFKDFQFVIVLPNSAKAQVVEFVADFNDISKSDEWQFVFTSTDKLHTVFKSFRTDLSLTEGGFTPYVFIVDKEMNLRGRNDEDGLGSLYGYDSGSVAELNNKMNDDIKVILAEYRLALKKYKADRKN